MTRTVAGGRHERAAASATGLGVRIIPPTDPTLQAQIDALPAGGVLNIGSQHFLNPQPVIISAGKSIVGNPDAEVGIVPSTLRNWQTLIVRGAGTKLTGFQVKGNQPDNHSYVVTLEAQHAVEVQGADDIELRNMFFHNVYGDAVAFQKDSGGNPNRRCRIIDCYADEIGRCLFTPIAVDDLTVRNFKAGNPNNPAKLGRIDQSIIDIEPPGNIGWMCKNLLWTDCDYRCVTPSFVIARLGQGTDFDIDNIVLDSINTHNQIFSVTIGPPDALHGGPVRDSRYYFQSCGSSTNFASAHAPFRVWRTDVVELHGVTQTSSSPSGLAEMSGCTGVVIDATVIHQRASEDGEWYAYDDGTYWKWSD